jgi:hypothetical protein
MTVILTASQPGFPFNQRRAEVWRSKGARLSWAAGAFTTRRNFLTQETRCGIKMPMI